MKFLKKYPYWIAAALLIGAFFIYRSLYSPVSIRNDSVFFEIAPQENFSQTVDKLKETDLIGNKTLLSLYARATGLDTQIKAGRFQIDPELSPVALLNFLSHPEYGEISVTFPEGFSVFEIDAKLTSLGLIQKNEFTKWTAAADTSKFTFLLKGFPVEGFLFPDTYLVFAKNLRSQDLGAKMLDTFQKKIFEPLHEDFTKSKRTVRDIIIMASILEKEAREKEDLPLVSGILWKRLDNGWPLQADATLLYGKKERQLDYADTRDDSAYNTYTRQGLPAGPIANPGLATIQAALKPTESPYWFYLTSRDGKMIYSKTNKEHEQNKRKYL